MYTLYIRGMRFLIVGGWGHCRPLSELRIDPSSETAKSQPLNSKP